MDGETGEHVPVELEVVMTAEEGGAGELAPLEGGGELVVRGKVGVDGQATSIISLERLKFTEGTVPCPGCNKELRRSQLAIHMRKKNCEAFMGQLKDLVPSVMPPPVVGRVKCPQPSCVHISPNLKALRKHFASKHAPKMTCSKCNLKEYGRSDALRKHERTCGASFPALHSSGCVQLGYSSSGVGGPPSHAGVAIWAAAAP